MTVAKRGHSSLMNISGRRLNDVFMAFVVERLFKQPLKIVFHIVKWKKKLCSESLCCVGKSKYVIL